MVTSLAESLSPSTAQLPLVHRDEWVMQANCRDCDPDALFVRGAAQREAAAICEDCPVILTCRADALDNRVEFGVWGGLTERQRRAILRRYPDVHNWREFFANGGDIKIA
ncbi:MAG: WhiB family transcriptional regulator [Corynebacterium sp.]|nr:WhiB family transcriptional regulator [Corynebacterium sp.]